MLCAIYHHLHNLLKLEKQPCRNFTKINTSPWVVFKFFKLYNGTKSCNALHMNLPPFGVTIVKQTYQYL